MPFAVLHLLLRDQPARICEPRATTSPRTVTVRALLPAGDMKPVQVDFLGRPGRHGYRWRYGHLSPPYCILLHLIASLSKKQLFVNMSETQISTNLVSKCILMTH